MKHRKYVVLADPSYDKCSVCGAKRLLVGTQRIYDPGLRREVQTRGWVLQGKPAWDCPGKPAEVSEKK